MDEQIQQAIEKRKWYDASKSGPLSHEEREDFLANYDWLIKIAGIKEDGWPYVVPVWYLWEDGAFWVVGRKRSEWVQDLIRDPRCAICIEEREIPPAGGNRKVLAQCLAEVVDGPCVAEGSKWVTVAEKMALKYVGPDGPAALARSYCVGALPRQADAPRREDHDLPGRRLAPAILRPRPAARPRGSCADDLARRAPGRGRGRQGVKTFAARAEAAKRSAIREVFDAANRRPDAIRLEIGEPSFRTPDHIVDGALEAAPSGVHQVRAERRPALSLRELLSEKLARVDGYTAGPDQIVVTPGGDERALLDLPRAARAGRRGAAADARLPQHGRDGEAARRRARLLRAPPAGGLPARSRPARVARRPRGRRRCSRTRPGNPTGAVFPASWSEELVAFAERHDLYLIADEVYDEMVLDDDREHVAAARFDGSGRVVSVYSFSKIYAMTGWRLGYAVCSPRPRRSASQAPGAGGVVPEHDLAEGRGGGAHRTAGADRRDARRLPGAS